MTITVSVWWVICIAVCAYWFGYFIRYLVYHQRPFGKVLIEKSTDPNENDLVSFQFAGEIEELYSMKRITLLIDVREGRSKNNSVNDKT